MVDVGDKDVTHRVAVARGFVYMAESTLDRLVEGEVEKGDVSQVARIAGIMGAKQTSDLVPLCHPLPLEDVDLDFRARPDEPALEIRASASCHGKTGVEMEALTAVSVAALTVYDMAKSVDKGMHVGDIHLVEKTGGQSGDFTHPDPPGPPAPDADAEEG